MALLPAKAQPEDIVVDRGTRSSDVVLSWNAELLDADAADHARAAPDQGGPTRASRAFAIVSAAMFDALNSITHNHRPYLTELRGYDQADRRAAVTAAAYHTLVALYPQRTDAFDEALDRWLDKIRRGESRMKGLELGRKVAEAILAERADDGWDAPSNYAPVNQPGRHRVDPNNPNQGFLGPAWGNVAPFVADDIDDFVPPPPPPLASQEYADAYQELILLGGDGITTPTIRSPEQTEIGLYWAYDGRPGLGTPPRLYNQIVRVIAIKKENTSEENARLLVLVNLAMADAGISCWRGKYLYDFWRPIVGIREGDDDGNDQTDGDLFWNPLGAPLTNGPAGAPNFTPPFPAYASGHATFGAAALWTVKNFYGQDRIPFAFMSDELNGINADQDGNVRPRVVRRFRSLSEAIEENAQSRIYLGIHWQFDAQEGVNCGIDLADFVFDNALQRRDGRR
ncbi:MAG: phosphatase PAP2 family protein [Planctomycetaceae bacterium]|nr:phosphatase PAP2 family protein [Planctomycetaceae bacterium]